jgi:hypothetical protein
MARRVASILSSIGLWIGTGESSGLNEFLPIGFAESDARARVQANSRASFATYRSNAAKAISAGSYSHGQDRRHEHCRYLPLFELLVEGITQGQCRRDGAVLCWILPRVPLSAFSTTPRRCKRKLAQAVLFHLLLKANGVRCQALRRSLFPLLDKIQRNIYVQGLEGELRLRGRSAIDEDIHPSHEFAARDTRGQTMTEYTPICASHSGRGLLHLPCAWQQRQFASGVSLTNS